MRLLLLLFATLATAKATLVADFFQRADAASSLGSTYWTCHAGALGISSSAMRGGSSSDSYCSHSGTSGAAADQKIMFKITAKAGGTGSANYRGVALRMQNPTTEQTYYDCYTYDNSSSGNCRRWNSGVASGLGAWGATTAVGDVVTAEVSGSGATVTIVVHQYDSTGAEKSGSPTTYSDTSGSRITAAGPMGLTGKTSSAGVQLDDWISGNLADTFPPLVPTFADEMYVDDGASLAGTGTKASPMLLHVLLSRFSTSSTYANKIVWLRAGTYTPDYQVYNPGMIWKLNLPGSASGYIKFRAYPGETAKFDPALSCIGVSSGLYVISLDGQYIELDSGYGTIEITNSNTACQLLDACGSNPGVTPIRSVRQNSNNARLIDLYIHDTGEGITSQQVAGLTAIGNIVFNNGWNAPDRLHGHGRYYQNNNCAVTKYNKFNFMFRNASTQTKWFSQSGANVCNFSHQYDVLFRGGLTLSTEMSGSSPNDFTFDNNYLFNGSLIFNSDNNLASTVYFRNNHLDGGYTINRTNAATITGNVFANSVYASGGGGVSYTTVLYNSPYNTPAAAFASLTSNTYYKTASSGSSYAYCDTSAGTTVCSPLTKTFAQWQALGAAMDPGSTEITATYPANGQTAPGSTGYTYVNAHPEKPGVCQAVVYNYDRTSTKSVDVSACFATGDPVDVYDVQYMSGGPLATGTISGNLSLDTSAKTNYTAPTGSIDTTPWTFPYACPYSGAQTSDTSSVTRVQLRYVGGTHTGTVAQTFNIVTGSNDTIKLSVDGGAAQTVTLTAGAARTAAQVVSDINAGATGVTAVVAPGNKVEIATTALGNAHTLELQTVANSAYTTLGLTVGTQTGVTPIVVSVGVMTVTVSGTHDLGTAPQAVSISGATTVAFNKLYTTISHPQPYVWTANAPGGVLDGNYNEAGMYSEEGIYATHSAPTFAHTGQDFDVFLIRRQRTQSSFDYDVTNTTASSTQVRLKLGLSATALDWPTVTSAIANGNSGTITVDNHFPGGMYYQFEFLDSNGAVLASSAVGYDVASVATSAASAGGGRSGGKARTR